MPKPKSDLPTLEDTMSALCLDPGKIEKVQGCSILGPMDDVDSEDIYFVRTLFDEVERCVPDANGMSDDEKMRIGHVCFIFIAMCL